MEISAVHHAPFTRYNRLYNQFDSRLYRVNKHPTGLTTVLNEQPLFVQPVVKWVVQCLYTRYHRFIVKPVWQPVISCIQTFNLLSNRFDNRLYRV